MSQIDSDDHVLNYVTANRFYVEIESNISACFSECSGLSVKVKKETLLEGGLNNQQRILLGQAEFSDVMLKRGITNDSVFWDWVNQTISPKSQDGIGIAVSAQVQGVGGINGTLDPQSMSFKKSPGSCRRNVNILLFNQAGETMQCWTLIGAVPIGWKAPALQANANTVAIEELTLAYEGLKISKSSSGGASSLKERDMTGSFPSN
jgi:phage tail-like protein